MFTTGFSMAAERIAEEPFGPSTSWLVEQAARWAVWVGGSIPQRTPGADRPTNTFVLAGPTGELHRYAKIHPFSFAGEDDHYTAGDVTVTVEIGDARVTPFVCYDLRFADWFWDTAADTDCYVVVANWPAARRRHWIALLTARAIENQAYVVGVNRVNDDGNGVAYCGDSRIIDPLGEEIEVADDRETMLLADLDPARVADVRSRFPFMADR
ncbi:MAG: nitrilase-related carbon-nitrogen hydrolase, partial [Acidimicrobiales bacterium]